ncbi:hypothetical protein [Bacillus sp. ISL-57]|nr:hypothetical protein [Bacillus sp. ISL-57]
MKPPDCLNELEKKSQFPFNIFLKKKFQLIGTEGTSLQKNMNRQISYSQKLKQKLTMIQEKEGVIEWVFIFIMTEDGRLIHLVADKGFVIEPGEEYMGPPEMVNVAYQAFNGKAGITPS